MFTIIKYIFCILVLVGALNWGLIGIFNFNLVSAIFGDGTWLTRIIYILVGVGAIIVAFSFFTKDNEEHCRRM